MLIGGAQLYGQALEQELVDRMYLTQVDYAPEGDAWFPKVDDSKWKIISQDPQPAETDAPSYHFEVWDRR